MRNALIKGPSQASGGASGRTNSERARAPRSAVFLQNGTRPMRSLVVVGAVSTMLYACTAFSSDGAPGTDAPAPPPPGTPEQNSVPPLDGTPIDGVFVSSSRGAEGGSGSVDSPVKTLKRAFELARDRRVRVFACAEPYAENLDLLDGVSAYGYYDCTKTPWVRVTAKAVVNAPLSPAVIARGLKQATRLEGFELRAPDLDGTEASDTAGTSIAVDVRDSSNLVFAEALLHGGKGAPGTDGTDAPLNSRTNATSDGTDGANETSRTCPQPMIPLSVCNFSRTVPGRPGGATICAVGPNGGPGGVGGDPRHYASGYESNGPYEFRGRALVATAATAAGGGNTSPTTGYGYGMNGSAGGAGTEGPDGVNGAWSLSATGFSRGIGTAGGAAGPGQGGGGGGSPRGSFDEVGTLRSTPTDTFWNTASGGGGGAGGCAGQAGTPATGGGASIGAFVVSSTLTFDRVRIESAAGGRGGKGNLGSAGTPGGSGGLGIIRPFGSMPRVSGRGGAGGPGGNGGSGGHGAPGPSIALAYGNARPTITDSELVPGPAGAGQPELRRDAVGGLPGKVLPAIDGVSLAESQIP